MPFAARLQHLLIHLKEIGADGCVINTPIDLYYFTGLDLSAGTLIASSGTAHLFVDGRYYEMCKQHAPYPVTLVSDEALKVFLKEHSTSAIAFDSGVTTYAAYEKLCRVIPESFTLVPQMRLMHHVRMVKEKEEIEALRSAAELAGEGFDYLLTRLREGVTEKTLAKELELFLIERGGEGFSFDPIIAFGPHAAMPHYTPGDVPLKRDTIVLIDMGVQLNRYQSDMTRVVFFGEPPEPMVEVRALVEQSVEAGIAACRPGITAGEIDKISRDVIESGGYGEYFTHSLGHGVGLEVHEAPVLRNAAPFSDLVMEANTVVTIEPGIYLPGVGGVRLEDTILITEDGPESFTRRPFFFQL